MAVTEQSYAGDGSQTNYPFTFPYLKSTDIQVQLDQTSTTNWSLANATTIQFTAPSGGATTTQEAGGAPKSGVAIKILRDTNVDNLTATFYAGSAIKSEDLNDNYTQNLYKTQEIGNRSFQNTGTSTMIGHLQMGEDTTIKFEGATDNAHETTLTVVDPTADRTITLPNVTGTVVTTGDTGTVAHAMLAGDAVDGDNIADNSVNSEHYVDGSIDRVHLEADIIDGTKLADNAVNTEHITTGAVDSSKIADGTIVNADVSANAGIAYTKLDVCPQHKILVGNASETPTPVTMSGDATITSTGEITIANDAVEQSMIANDAVGADQLAADAVVNASVAAGAAIAHNKLANVTDGQILVGNGSNVPTAVAVSGDVTLANTGAVTIANTAVEEGMLASGAVTETKIGNDQVTADKLADHASTDSSRAVTTDHIRDNAITIAKIGCEETTLTVNSDVKLPTSKAVADHVSSVVNALGGFVAINGPTNFPATQPSQGVVVSIKDVGSGFTTSSNEITITNGAGTNKNVKITDFPSEYAAATLVDDTGLQVTSDINNSTSGTPAVHVYKYHKQLAKESDVKALSDDINNFNERYRTAANRTADNSDTNHDGDLFYDQSANKMYVYDGAYNSGGSWKEVTSTGQFKILTMVTKDATSGLTLNGPADGGTDIVEFDLRDGSNAASVTQAAQLLISINGVIQKANSGTTISGSDEGFCLVDSNTIKFATAPNNGDSIFVHQSGSAVTLSVPADGSITEAMLNANAPTNDHVLTADSSAASGFKWAATAAGVGGASGADFNDDVKLRFGHDDGGSGGDVDSIQGQLWWDETNNYFNLGLNTGSTHKIDISAQTVEIRGVNRSSNMAIFRATAGQDLFYSTSKKFETTNTGVTITGDLDPAADSSHDLGTSAVRWQNGYFDTLYGDGSNLTGVASATADGCMYENDQTISNAYTIAANKGAHSVGPVTVGNTVTISNNARWVIS